MVVAITQEGCWMDLIHPVLSRKLQAEYVASGKTIGYIMLSPVELMVVDSLLQKDQSSNYRLNVEASELLHLYRLDMAEIGILVYGDVLVGSYHDFDAPPPVIMEMAAIIHSLAECSLSNFYPGLS